MLYEKNKTERLSDSLFENPTAEYRGAPFWAWNDALSEEECLRQAEIFRKMGFGGFHMHPRDGLSDEYLGETFRSVVKACVKDAKENGSLAWLYDEDRYPSGFGGGFVTKDGRFRRRALVFTSKKRKEDASFSNGRQNGGSRLLATYALRLFGRKCLGYKRLSAGEKAFGKKYYAYLVVDEPTDKFNMAGYVDALSKDALTSFADYTYGAYQEIVGEEFGKTVPAIFTDEPQMKFVRLFKNAFCLKEAVLPWTDDFAETYKKAFGADILDYLPELFIDGNSPTQSRTRFFYHTHRTERFAEAFADNLGVRAEEIGLSLTGHLMEEPTLESQSKAVGEAMRQYKRFGIPGLDLLCGRHEYTTAKQVESVVRQEGKEAMLCEQFGVSRWAVEFGKFKEEGDWLSCLGVTVRVPHLVFYSMRGEAKRDYPPSIFYQSPWYLKFKPVEDHFARLTTALSRGKAINDVAVIHPIESYFLNLAAGRNSKKEGQRLNRNFLTLTDWLLFGECDFDFISESLLPSQRGEDPLAVGECKYKTILVPSLLTLRRTTLEYLRSFRAAGGRVVFLGNVPALIDGTNSEEALSIAKECEVVAFEKDAVLSAIGEREISILSKKRSGEYLSTLRSDDSGRWLFLTAPRAGFPYPRSVTLKNDPNVIEDEVLVGLKGEWSVKEYDTMTGEIRPMPCSVKKGVTYVSKTLYNNDSLLLRYDAATEKESEAAPSSPKKVVRSLSLPNKVKYDLSEPNVLLLDKAKWSVGERFHARLDLDLVTARARKALGLPKYRSELQPWLREKDKEKKEITMRFEFRSEIASPAHFACEYKEFSLTVNGKKVEAESDGYYVDLAFKTFPIEIKKGANVIDVRIPIGKYDRCENCYLLGSFAVKLKRTKATLLPLPGEISFGDLTRQGFPFYGGKITYRTAFTSNGEDAIVSARYASALLTVALGGKEQDVFFAPYEAKFPTEKGENEVFVTAYISRENAFGPVHIRKKYKLSDSPSWYHKTRLPWRVKEYVFDKTGVLSSPVVRLIEKN